MSQALHMVEYVSGSIVFQGSVWILRSKKTIQFLFPSYSLSSFRSQGSPEFIIMIVSEEKCGWQASEKALMAIFGAHSPPVCVSMCCVGVWEYVCVCMCISLRRDLAAAAYLPGSAEKTGAACMYLFSFHRWGKHQQSTGDAQQSHTLL